MFNYTHKASDMQTVRFSRDGKSILYSDLKEKFII